MKYLVKHWINVDMIAEEVIDDLISRLTEDEVDQYEHLINNHFGDEQ